MIESHYFYINQSILITTAVCLLLCMIIASLRIRKDKNDVLDDVERIIFYISTLQQFLYFAFLIQQLTIFASGLRILNLISVLLLWDSFDKLYSSRNSSCYQNLSLKLKCILFLIVAGLWIIIVLVEGKQYYCSQGIWMIFSSLSFFINIINLYIGSSILANINTTFSNLQNYHQSSQLELLKQIDLRNTQQKVFLIIVLELFSSATLLFWDFESIYENNQLYCIQTGNFTENLIVLAMLIIAYQFPSAGFYVVYYRKNRRYILYRRAENSLS